MIAKKQDPENRNNSDSIEDDFVRLKSQILALHELLDVADENVIQQASSMEHLNEELAKAKIQLENQREDTVAYLMHDISNQLVGQRMLLDHLQKINMVDDYTIIVDSLLKSNERIRRTIENLVRVDEYDSENYRYSFQMINVIPICNQAINIVMNLADTKNIRIEANFEENLPELRLDEKSFTYALTTILKVSVQNALIGQEVDFSVFQKNSDVIISICDEEDKPLLESGGQLFERFWQGERMNDLGKDRPFEMFISNKIVKEHSGKIVYDTSDDTETKISVILPLNRE